MPKMPELKTWKGDKTLGIEMDWDNFEYKEKSREKARKEALEAERAGEGQTRTPEDAKRKRKNNEAWSNKVEQEEVRVERREKRRKKREAEKTSKMTDEEKMKQVELNELIAQVRAQNQAKATKQEEEFEGFGD
jgi:ATP-dependent RNA helicase DDX55/SPB4